MGRVRRPRMSAREKVELWKRWKRGESLSDIGRALGRIPGAVHHVVSARGGIPPPSRTRSRRSLTLTEREEISRGLARGYSVRQIGVRLSRAPSTISREVRRNGGRRQYRASVADARAWDRARRPKPCRLALSPLLRALVAEKLAADWSPQQIAGWLKRTFPKDPCPTFAVGDGCVGPSTPARRASAVVRSSTPSRFESVRRRQRIGPCPATGKATY